MNAKTSPSSVETEIRDLIQRWQRAVVAKDIDAIVQPYADDIVAFDAVKALQFKGKQTYRDHWQACMALCPDAGIFDFEQLQVAAAQDVAFAHWLAHCGPAREAGEDKSCYMRVTAGYKRIDGQWKVVHEHWSAPFDMETTKALFNLKP
ncbi:YybH family protein [Pseudomonas akapageensis]|uniref:YybH family protein n=1 Tax=Pseudomonas akapageensis TaxID=2609961 RepID=UPI00140AE618|nr:SgcJ/EcaC family oxidoreductase [Pseudomonas akapageensis]